VGSDVLAPIPFDEIWAVDFEFRAEPGEPPEPICLVARELRSGRTVTRWQDELRASTAAPYGTDENSLMVAFYASAEIGCHIGLGWSLPERVLDLYAEFRCLRSGHRPPLVGGWGLLGALHHYGIGGIGTSTKQSMRELAMRGGPWSDAEREALISYCTSDVEALEHLLPRMLADIDLPRAILRGRYMRAAARIENVGVPIDLASYTTLRARWDDIKDRLVRAIDSEYGVYEGTSFKAKRFEQWLISNEIPWPRLPSGALDLDDDAFRDMAKAHPRVAPLRELRHALGKMRLSELAVGRDARNRCMLSAFASKTGRNQPSNSRYIFGPSCWLRSLIQPAPGLGVSYVDWSQQEFGIGAALSGDEAMMHAYSTGDPYLAFAVQAGAAPHHATKATHGAVRDRFKACVLAVGYCMGASSLALRLGIPIDQASQLLQLHRRTYPGFWRWAEGSVDHAMAFGWLHTVFGWRIHTTPDSNARSLQNFGCQANGAEMLRLACCYATEAGIRVCAPVHDAVLIEAPINDLDRVTSDMQAYMARASRDVLGGFELRTDVKRVLAPDRYVDERGRAMWSRVWSLIDAQPIEVARAG